MCFFSHIESLRAGEHPGGSARLGRRRAHSARGAYRLLRLLYLPPAAAENEALEAPNWFFNAFW